VCFETYDVSGLRVSQAMLRNGELLCGELPAA